MESQSAARHLRRDVLTVVDELALHHLETNRIDVTVLNELAVFAHTRPRIVTQPLTGWPSVASRFLWPDNWVSRQMRSFSRARATQRRPWSSATP
jgi:hypothetical protein